jgi:hypothetical protein
VTGPAGSSQDTFTGAVEWITPQSGGQVGHWAIAVEAVAATPTNDSETDIENNRVVRNAFDIDLAPGQTSVFGFNIYGDPQQAGAPVNLEVIRSGSLDGFQVELSLHGDDASLTYEGLKGLTAPGPAGMRSMQMLQDRARVEGIQLPDGKPGAARLVIRAPDVDNETLSDPGYAPARITINARNEFGIIGGLTVDVRIDPDAAKLNRIIYAQK